MEKLKGVASVESGYTGGHGEQPSYEQVSAGNTGHYEAVRVFYDSKQLSYADLLKAFWQRVDPTDPDGQFCDKGPQYRAAVFTSNEEETKIAQQSKQQAERALGQKIVTEIVDARQFYSAEQYHQDYYLKNPIRYKYYRNACGRDARIDALWKRAVKP